MEPHSGRARFHQRVRERKEVDDRMQFQRLSPRLFCVLTLKAGVKVSPVAVSSEGSVGCALVQNQKWPTARAVTVQCLTSINAPMCVW